MAFDGDFDVFLINREGTSNKYYRLEVEGRVEHIEYGSLQNGIESYTHWTMHTISYTCCTLHTI